MGSLIAHRLDEEQGEEAALHRLRVEVEAVLAGPHPMLDRDGLGDIVGG